MNHLPKNWSEAQRRAEIYLRALHGRFGPAERQLVAAAISSARGQLRLSPATHPVTLVMEALFGCLPSGAGFDTATMMPPIQRARMLPEATEFPLHDWLRRCCRRVGGK